MDGQKPILSEFNWNNGTWTSSCSSSPVLQSAEASGDCGDCAQICIAGDWAPIRHFQGIVEESPESIYGDLLRVLRRADLSIANLEAPLSDVGEAVWKSGAVFKGEKKHVRGLGAVPFDAVTLANNHMFDFGVEAFQESLDALDEQHIQWTGAGNSLKQAAEPLVMTVKGLKIAVVNFSEGEDLTAAEENKPGVMGWDLPRMEAVIRELKGRVDCIMVIAHCGIEYIPFPPPYVAKAFERMVDAGAHVVIGHHPHVPQGVQFYKNVPIFYSLGNFVFYQETRLKYRKLGYMVNIGIGNSKNHNALKGRESSGNINGDKEKHGDVAMGESNTPLTSVEVVPYEIHDQGVSLLKGEKQNCFFSKFREISLPLNDPAQFDKTWHAFLHYYGTKGFFSEIAMLTERIKTEPRKGAAMFRNRLTTLQHYHHWKDTMNRIVEGKLEDSPRWARDIVDEWLTTLLP